MDGSVGAFDAKTHLSALLDRVEKGEEITITRRGVPVARLVPARAQPGAAEVMRASEVLRQLRAQIAARGGPPFTWEELRDMRDEGRR
jgi:prevent-host-death family protein